jgi:hypothetical protein
MRNAIEFHSFSNSWARRREHRSGPRVDGQSYINGLSTKSYLVSTLWRRMRLTLFPPAGRGGRGRHSGRRVDDQRCSYPTGPRIRQQRAISWYVPLYVHIAGQWRAPLLPRRYVFFWWQGFILYVFQQTFSHISACDDRTKLCVLLATYNESLGYFGTCPPALGTLKWAWTKRALEF